MTVIEARRNALLAVLCLLTLLVGAWIRLGLLVAAVVLVGALQGYFLAIAQSWTESDQ